MKPLLQNFLIALSLTSSGLALAQSAGTWSGRLGVTRISPQVSSGNLTAPSFPGTQTDVGDSTRLSGGLTYMLSDNVALDLPIAPAFRHTLYGVGALAGAGGLGSVKALPITLMGQYRWGEAAATWRPYIGLGLTYARFFGEAGSGALTALTNPGGSATRLSVESKWAPTAQIGLRYAIDGAWFIDGSLSTTSLKTRTSFSTGQTIDTRLDPLTYSLGLGMRF